MAAGKLYTYPENFRAQRALVAAQYAGVTLEVISQPPAFKFGETNKSDDFLAKFPLGKVPAFESKDGTCIFEANAIARYVGDKLHGSDKTQSALVEQWISFADNEIVPASCTWVFPCLGLIQLNKGNTTKAKEDIKTALTVLDNCLKTRTFLVGERVSQADITVCTSLIHLFQYVLDPEFRKPFVNVCRWFTTCINQPQFKSVIGEVKLCETMAQFDAAKYKALHGQSDAGGSGKQKQQPAKGKKQEKKPEKEEEPEEDEPSGPPVEPPFSMDAWKKKYRNNDVKVSIPYLWENFNPEEYSLFKCEYAYLENIPKAEFQVSNLVSGMFQRLDAIRKHAFGLIAYFGKAPELRIHGVFLWKSKGNIFDGRDDLCGDHESYTWTKLDHTNSAHKKMFEDFLKCEDNLAVDGRTMIDVKMFV